MAPPGTGALDCLPGATAPSIEQIPDRGQPETLILAITSNMLKNSNVLLIPHAAAITERNVTQRYLAPWTPRLLSIALFAASAAGVIVLRCCGRERSGLLT